MKNSIYYILLYFIVTLFINVNADLIYHHDTDWMSYINNSTKINEINIPRYSTYNIDHYVFNTSFPILTSIFSDNVKGITGKTQDLNITEQLESGIRYLDIRLGLNNKTKKLYITHGPFACLEPDGTFISDYTRDYNNYKEYENYTYLYFENVIKYCIEFLRKYRSETIIIHLNKEDINIKVNTKVEKEKEKLINEKISNLIEEIYNKFDTKENLYYKDYIYVPENNDEKYTNENLPILGIISEYGKNFNFKIIYLEICIIHNIYEKLNTYF